MREQGEGREITVGGGTGTASDTQAAAFGFRQSSEKLQDIAKQRGIFLCFIPKLLIGENSLVVAEGIAEAEA